MGADGSWITELPYAVTSTIVVLHCLFWKYQRWTDSKMESTWPHAVVHLSCSISVVVTIQLEYVSLWRVSVWMSTSTSFKCSSTSMTWTPLSCSITSQEPPSTKVSQHCSHVLSHRRSLHRQRSVEHSACTGVRSSSTKNHITLTSLNVCS